MPADPRTSGGAEETYEAAVRHAPEGVTVELYEGLAELPFYNEDIDVEDQVPEAAVRFRAALAAADALLVVTPESASASVSDDRSFDVESALAFVMSVPDEVLNQGEDATREWLHMNAPEAAHSSGTRVPRADIFGCAGAIAAVLASTAIPASKVLRLKNLINELGGVAHATRIMWGASFSHEKLKA